MKRNQRMTVYRFRAMNVEGDVRVSRLFARLHDAKRQARYWGGRGYAVTIEATTEPATFAEVFRWVP